MVNEKDVCNPIWEKIIPFCRCCCAIYILWKFKVCTIRAYDIVLQWYWTSWASCTNMQYIKKARRTNCRWIAKHLSHHFLNSLILSPSTFRSSSRQSRPHCTNGESSLKLFSCLSQLTLPARIHAKFECVLNNTNAVFVILCIYGMDLECAKYLVYIDLLTCAWSSSVSVYKMLLPLSGDVFGKQVMQPQLRFVTVGFFFIRSNWNKFLLNWWIHWHVCDHIYVCIFIFNRCLLCAIESISSWSEMHGNKRFRGHWAANLKFS